MKKISLIIMIIIGVVVISLTIFSIYTLQEKKAEVDISSIPINVKTQAIKITYDNFVPFLSDINLIQELPKDALISLSFYNFNSGLREIEKSYILTKGEIKEGISENEDISIYIHSKYLSQLTTTNFCSIIQNAKNNGDLDIDLKANQISLAWKYRYMMKYKSCLGF